MEVKAWKVTECPFVDQRTYYCYGKQRQKELEKTTRMGRLYRFHGFPCILVFTLVLLLADRYLSEKVRVVTKEELARHDGKQVEGVYWLAIMSKVYDVSKGAQEFYDEGGYNVFIGRDGNVPFITGEFTEEEAARPILDLTPHQLWNLNTWAEFYEKEERYPFIGVLEGDLYDKEGNPTAMMERVQELIVEGHDAWHAARDENKRKVEQSIREAEARKNDEAGHAETVEL